MAERIAPSDAIWLQDSDTNPMMINAVIVTDRLDLQVLRGAFRRRIFAGAQAGRFERLRCRVAGTGHGRTWEPDPDFDLARHIVARAGKALASMEAVRGYVGREVSRRLDPAHPMWQIQLLGDVGDDASAILVRFHHSIGDGEALVFLLLALMDGASERRWNGAVPGHVPWLGRLLKGASIQLRAPGILLRRLAWSPDRSRVHGPALSGRKQVAWTAPLDLEVVKEARRRTGATVNDVLMAAVSGALSRYLARSGAKAPSRFLVSMPVNVRAPGTLPRCGNRFAPVPLELPAGSFPLASRIRRVKARMDEMKRGAVPVVVDELQRSLLTFLPEALSRGVIDFLANKCTAVVTNVAGPREELALKGRRVRSIVFWVPQRARIGLGISILSLAGKVQLGIIADKALVPDPRVLVRAFEEQFEALKSL